MGPSRRKLMLKVILGSSSLHTSGPTIKTRGKVGKALCSNEKTYRYSFRKKNLNVVGVGQKAGIAKRWGRGRKGR